MGWWEALGSLGTAFTEVFRWATGGRTRAQSAIEREVEQLESDHDAAIQMGDLQRASDVRDQLRRLRDKAQARRAGR